MVKEFDLKFILILKECNSCLQVISLLTKSIFSAIEEIPKSMLVSEKDFL